MINISSFFSVFSAGLFIGTTAATLLFSFLVYNKTCTEDMNKNKTILDLIGNTPLIEIRSLSKATNCTILYLNPGGSIKDRIAHKILNSLEDKGLIKPDSGYTIYEGTVGSTGISLALICLLKGYNCCIVLPDDQAKEKYQYLDNLKAKTIKVRPASIVDSNMFVNKAKELAKIDKKGYFIDQFENELNYVAHYETTGPEIYKQTQGKIDAFICGAGTGGTITGIGLYLKQKLQDIKIYLADPIGSGLYFKVKYNTFYATEEKEGTKKRHQVDTIVEGVGINRLTSNFRKGLKLIEDAFKVDDSEAVLMSKYLMKNEGLFVGSSSCLNLVGAYKLAKKIGPNKTIVTILCDSGARHTTKFWNDEYLDRHGLPTECPNDLSFIKI